MVFGKINHRDRERIKKTCQWYVNEIPDVDKSGRMQELSDVHCTDDSGFCLLQEFFTGCTGMCDDYVRIEQWKK